MFIIGTSCHRKQYLHHLHQANMYFQEETRQLDGTTEAIKAIACIAYNLLKLNRVASLALYTDVRSRTSSGGGNVAIE